MVPGIDVSHWQNDKSTPQKMDFTKSVDQGAKFVFIKVSERGGIDVDYEYNWKAAKEAGLLRGGYHFLRWDLSAQLQARIFCDILKDDPGELPPVADFEAPPKATSGGTIYPSNALLEAFLIEVENRLGRKPMIYTSPGFWNTNGKNKGTSIFDPKWKYWPLWVAHYTTAEKPIVPQPWKEWLFWQYSATGPGLLYGAESKGLDMNWFNGSLQDLYKLANQDEPGTPEPPTVPPGTTIDIESLRLRINVAIDQWAENI
jgi:lysozyme